MTDKYDAVLLFGAPGSGKGLQGSILNSIPGIFHCAMGDIFRNLDKESDLGKLFMDYSTKGLLVPDELTIKIWKAHLEKKVEEKKFNPDQDLLLLDGFPRTVEQATIVTDYVNIVKVLHLNCKDQNILIERIKSRCLKENRKDDGDEAVIKNRMDVYDRETHPVLDKFDKSVIADIEASNTPIKVLYDILEVVIPVSK